jgi:hypothetical protein
MDKNNYHPDRWRDEVLEEVLRAMARYPELNKALIFKGARVLKQLLGMGRSSLDVDSSFSAEFTDEHPSREDRISFIRDNFTQALNNYFNSMDIVRYSVQRVEIRHRPTAEHPFGWNGVKIALSVADGELAGIENLPDLEIEVSAAEKYDENSVAKLKMDSTEVNAYTLERCIGEKFRAFLSSTPNYRQKIRRPEAMPLRVKDLYDIALAMRVKPISTNEVLWRRVGVQFKLACEYKFVDCAGASTFIATWQFAEPLYREDPTLPKNIPWEEAAHAVETAAAFFEQIGVLPFEYPSPSEGTRAS